MKKKALILVVMLLIPALMLSGCFLFQKDGVALIQNELGLDASAGSVNILLNTRKDGGEGLSFVSVSFDDSTFCSQLAAKESFRSLPFSDELTELLYSTEILVNDKGELLFPYAENGYYYFDARLENTDNAEITQDQGAELIVALYDADKNDFYYCHIDIENINVISEIQSIVKQQ